MSRSLGVKSKLLAAFGFSAATVCDALLRLTQNSAVSKFSVPLGFEQVPFTQGTSGIGPTVVPPLPEPAAPALELPPDALLEPADALPPLPLDAPLEPVLPAVLLPPFALPFPLPLVLVLAPALPFVAPP